MIKNELNGPETALAGSGPFNSFLMTPKTE